MGILPSQRIRALCVGPHGLPRNFALITPFHERTVHAGMTFGLSGAGYDIRLAEDTWLWPWRCTLRSSIEHFCLPWDLLFKVHDKSTNARRGVLVQNTVAEPGWHGYLTLEITKEWRWPYIHKLRRGTPIAQVIFHRLEERTDQPYKGKYQNQATGPQGAIMERPHKRPAMLDEYNVKDWMRP